MIDLKEKLSNNMIFWGNWYFPHHFRKDSPPFHFKIIEEAQKNSFLAIGAPRESSKTTILGFLYPMHRICNKKTHFIVVITSVYTKSCNILDTIKYELKYNQQLIEDYDISIPRDAEGDSILRHPDGFETRILCKGRDQVGDIRGEKFGAYRPDLILIDDIEDDKMVENPDRRIELQNLFDQVIMFAGEEGVTQIIVIGTMLHDDSQLAKLLDPNQYKQFRKLLFKARHEESGNKYSIWKEKWSVEDLDKKEANDPVSFAKEMQNDPVSGRRAKFHKEDFRYWKIDNMNYVLMGDENEIIGRGELSTCKAAIACDLAWEEKRENDYSVVLPAYLTPNSDILVENYICKKGLRPDEIEEIIFSMEQRLKSITKSSVYVGFEKAKLEKVMTWLLKQAMRKRNHYLNLKELQWDMDKIQRIVTRLQPRYTQHVIYHKHGMGELEHQLLRVPSGVHDDLPDALQGIIQLLEYPRQLPKQETPENHFDWLRRKAIEAKKPKRDRFIFGKKLKTFGIPAQESFQ